MHNGSKSSGQIDHVPGRFAPHTSSSSRTRFENRNTDDIDDAALLEERLKSPELWQQFEFLSVLRDWSKAIALSKTERKLSWMKVEETGYGLKISTLPVTFILYIRSRIGLVASGADNAQTYPPGIVTYWGKTI